MKKRTVIGVVVLLIAVASSIYLAYRNAQLEDELGEKEAANSVPADSAYAQKVKKIDSLLYAGDYQAAAEGYENIDSGNQNTDLDLELRRKVASNFLALSKQAQSSSASTLISTSSSEESNLDMRDADSLRFELEKANLRLGKIQSELKRRSFGQYLNFESSKGNQMHYVGQVQQGKANGEGIAILDSGSLYEGQWKDNMRHGQGKFFWSDGQYYVGNYENDKRSGEGTYFWSNGDKYVGEWENDKRNGYGKFYNKSKELLASGIWKEDELVEED